MEMPYSIDMFVWVANVNLSASTVMKKVGEQ